MVMWGVRIKRALGAAVLVLIVFYVADDLCARFGFPGGKPVFGSVEVRRSYAVPQKNKKLEYYFDSPAPQACVNAILPHFGVKPCWYLKRHKDVQVDM